MKSEERELRWIQESPPYWDAAKARIIGAAPPGTFGPDRLSRLRDGDLLPGDWFRVEAGDRVVGFGWMDTTWGDAEILLAVDPERRNVGVGSFILDHLEEEARARGLNYVYNTVSPRHPDGAGVTAWLERRHFTSFEDGSLRHGLASVEP